MHTRTYIHVHVHTLRWLPMSLSYMAAVSLSLLSLFCAFFLLLLLRDFLLALSLGPLSAHCSRAVAQKEPPPCNAAHLLDCCNRPLRIPLPLFTRAARAEGWAALARGILKEGGGGERGNRRLTEEGEREGRESVCDGEPLVCMTSPLLFFFGGVRPPARAAAALSCPPCLSLPPSPDAAADLLLLLGVELAPRSCPPASCPRLPFVLMPLLLPFSLGFHFISKRIALSHAPAAFPFLSFSPSLFHSFSRPHHCLVAAVTSSPPTPHPSPPVCSAPTARSASTAQTRDSARRGAASATAATTRTATSGSATSTTLCCSTWSSPAPASGSFSSLRSGSTAAAAARASAASSAFACAERRCWGFLLLCFVVVGPLPGSIFSSSASVSHSHIYPPASSSPGSGSTRRTKRTSAAALSGRSGRDCGERGEGWMAVLHCVACTMPQRAPRLFFLFRRRRTERAERRQHYREKYGTSSAPWVPAADGPLPPRALTFAVLSTRQDSLRTRTRSRSARSWLCALLRRGQGFFFCFSCCCFVLHGRFPDTLGFSLQYTRQFRRLPSSICSWARDRIKKKGTALQPRCLGAPLSITPP